MTILLTDRTTKYAIQNHIRAHCLDVCPAGRLAEPVRQHLCAQSDTGGHAGIFTVTSKQPQRHRVPQDTVGKSGGRERTADNCRICGQEVRRAIPGLRNDYIPDFKKSVDDYMLTLGTSFVVLM